MKSTIQNGGEKRGEKNRKTENENEIETEQRRIEEKKKRSDEKKRKMAVLFSPLLCLFIRFLVIIKTVRQC